MSGDNYETRVRPDQISKTISVLFIIYGALGILFLIGYPDTIIFAITNSWFIFLGILFYIFPTDRMKTIWGIIGLIGTFYAAVIYGDIVHSYFANAMVVYSLVLLALCFGAVCHVTCTWPNYEFD